MKKLFFFVALAVSVAASAQGSCGAVSATEGDDFWLTMLLPWPTEVNDGDGSVEVNLARLELYVVGEPGTGVHVENPLTGWSEWVTIGSSRWCSVLIPRINNSFLNTYVPEGYHVTADATVSVTAANIIVDATDAASVLTTRALGSRYVVQDYVSSSHTFFGGEVAILAVEDNTWITCYLPCDVMGGTLHAGDLVRRQLMRGEVLRLMVGGNDSLIGMEVTSNDKPFALFEGHPLADVENGSKDHLFEQAVPVPMWGDDYVLVPFCGRSADGSGYVGGDIVKVTAADSCVVTLDGLPLDTLGPRQSLEFALPPNSARRLMATAPVSVVQYMTTHRYGGDPGDPAMLVVVPADKGVCHACFALPNTPQTTFTARYVNVSVPTAAVDGMMLDGISAAAYFDTVDSQYSYACIPVGSGAHTLECSSGRFAAHAYALEWDETYAYNLGMEQLLPRDTVERRDTVCQHSAYSSPWPGVPDSCTADTGTFHFEYFELGDTILCYSLWLTVLPVWGEVRYDTLLPGDTIRFDDSVIVEAGDYRFEYTTAGGCDSVVTLHVAYVPTSITASADGVCPGEEVSLTAIGTRLFRWSATPASDEVASQQGLNPIVVHPTQTTTYSLLDDGGNILASFTVGAELPPVPCLSSDRGFVDFDSPIMVFDDCSEGSVSASWSFSDGESLTGKHVCHEFRQPLSDSVAVTLHTCNRYHCCADTSVVYPVEVRSVWFPNIFTPNEPQNNRFGAATTCRVVEFEMYIYNRWGFLVWSATDVGAMWDGTADGTAMPQGVYAYQYRLKDVHGNRWSGVGTVTLLR